MVNIGMAWPKTKNRNGFPGKRITEFDHTPAPKSCQRESAIPTCRQQKSIHRCKNMDKSALD
jgi:hypothetical protein